MEMKDKEPKERFHLVKGSIAAQRCDAVVNAANNQLRAGSGVCGAIHAAAGPELAVECRGIGWCDTGRSVITDAYRLPCRKVIHTVGPDLRPWAAQKLCDTPENLLESCYDTAIDLAIEHGLESVAFPCISTGVYMFPKAEAARIAYDTLMRRLSTDYRGEVTVCCFTDGDLEYYRRLMA